MSKNEVRRVVSLQASGGVFAEAWRGRPVRLSERLDVFAGDVVVLVEASPDLGEKTGREVQGSCAVDRAGGQVVRYLVPTLRWDLPRQHVVYDVSSRYPSCMTLFSS